MNNLRYLFQNNLLHMSLGIALVGSLAGYGLHVSAEGAPTAQPLWYAGTVADAQGAPLTGNHEVRLRLYTTPAGSEVPLCANGVATLPFVNGRFRVEISASCVEIMRANADLFVEVSVDDDSKPFPRSKIGAVPYALEAQHAVNASSANSVIGPQSMALEAASTTLAQLQQRLSNSSQVLGEVNGAMTGSGAQLNLGFNQRTTCVRVDSVASPGAFHFDCTCEAGEVAISGGASAVGGPNFLVESHALTVADAYVPSGVDPSRIWRVSCSNGTSRVSCLSISVACVRVTR